MHKVLHPDGLVFGVASKWVEGQVRSVFDPLLADGTPPAVITDLATAERVKVAANSFLATKISFINAMAEVCEATGADMGVLAQALSRTAGWGGHLIAHRLYPDLNYVGSLARTAASSTVGTPSTRTTTPCTGGTTVPSAVPTSPAQ